MVIQQPGSRLGSGIFHHLSDPSALLEGEWLATGIKLAQAV